LGGGRLFDCDVGKTACGEGEALTPETLGKGKADYAESEFMFYEVLVERIVEDGSDFRIATW
jgi:hypothetical protein